MYPQEEYLQQDSEFWAYVRLVSQQAGYQPRGDEIVKEYEEQDLQDAVESTGINGEPLFGDFSSDGLTELGDDILDYLNYRSQQVEVALNNIQTKEEARETFEEYRGDYELNHVQYNRQGNDDPLIFANTVNLVLEKVYGGEFDPDPYELPTVLDDEKNLQLTFAKRLDGALPNNRNPIALWEVKEFYSSSTFGSRVADAIYEIMLLSQEAQSIEDQIGREIEMYLLTDGEQAWSKGISYICRIIDILNMGYIDAAIFGKEVVEDWPEIVREWDEDQVTLPGE
jgi:hypothetical protein